jgi:hypothetical protein
VLADDLEDTSPAFSRLELCVLRDQGDFIGNDLVFHCSA